MLLCFDMQSGGRQSENAYEVPTPTRVQVWINTRRTDAAKERCNAVRAKMIMLEPSVLRTRFLLAMRTRFSPRPHIYFLFILFPNSTKTLALKEEATHPAGATNAETPRHATPKIAMNIPETRMLSFSM